MIVTCESCQAKYKLDDSKITGRGAKITCPKCRHVFVVYTQPAEPPSAPRAAPTAPPRPAAAAAPAPAPAPDSAWEDEPTRIGPSMSGGPPPWQPPPPESPPKAHPTISLPIEHDVAYLPPPQTPTPTLTPSEAAGRAAGLDFRKVGVAAWKVKVKIGIVYDFSDIKTLRKYIADGRVTPADVISHDGRSWRPIGEIPDLDSFFVETYERLEKAFAATPPPEPKVPAPSVMYTPSASTPVPEAAPAEQASPPPERAATNTFRDPFEDMKQRQREKAAQRKATPAEAPPRSRLVPILVAAAVLLTLGGAAWYATRPTDTPAPAATTVRPKTTPTAATDAKEALNDKLRRELTPVEAPPAVPGGEVVTAPNGGEELTPVVPPNVPAGAVPIVPGTRPTATVSTVTAGTTARTTAPTTTTVKESATTATDHEVMADASARSGDWIGAVKGYSNAVALDATNGRLLRKLGDAQYRAGDLDAASASLTQAAAKGQADAYKTLGRIARDNGDTAGAMGYYQRYLATNPKDAAEVQRIVQELGGA